MNNKFINTFLAGAFLVGISTPKIALFWNNKAENIQNRAENSFETNNPNVGLQQETKERVRDFTGTRSAIGTGKVVGVDGNTITITKDGQTYSIFTDSATKFRRKFWGTSNIDEIAVNNLVDVIGKWQNEERTQIRATLIRNLSVQKRYGVFFGIVVSKNESGFVIETAKREDQTVTISDDSKLLNRVMETVKLDDILIDHRVRIKGTWDNVNSTITNILEVKDFSIPIIPSPTPGN